METILQKISDALARGWALVRANLLAATLLAIILLVLLPLIYLKLLSRSTFVSPAWGFQMSCPSGWKVVPAKDKLSVACRKPGRSSSREAVIQLEMKFGNPYGNNALDYIQNGLVPQILYTYEDQQQSAVSFREPPSEMSRHKIIWAAMSFWVDMNELQVLRVAQRGERVYILLLVTRGTDPQDDEEAFRRTLDSVVIRDNF